MNRLTHYLSNQDWPWYLLSTLIGVAFGYGFAMVDTHLTTVAEPSPETAPEAVINVDRIPLEVEYLKNKDWRFRNTHAIEAFQTLYDIDMAIAAIDIRLEDVNYRTAWREYQHLRATYIEQRVLLLYHLYNLLHPDYTRDGDPPQP